MIFRTVAVVLLMLLPGISTAEILDPFEWLQRMAESTHRYSHEGTFIVQRDDKIDTVRIVHRAEDSGYQQRLQVLSGSPREVVRKVEHADAQSSTAVQSTRMHQEYLHRSGFLYGRLQEAVNHYHLFSPGKDRIAGQPCLLLRAEALDQYRYSQQYCLHLETGLPLLSELIDGDGQIIERMVFTDIQLVDSIGENALQAHDTGARTVHIQASHPTVDWQKVWLSEYSGSLPAGFEPITALTRNLDTDASSVLHLVFSDGLATVSLYIGTEHDPLGSFVGEMRSGATHALARSLGNHQITVVGEVPLETVERIASAARTYLLSRDSNSGE